MLRKSALPVCLVALTVTICAQAAQEPPPSAQIRDVRIPKLDKPPKLEEFLNGASRADMKRIDDFRQRNPGDGDPVSRKTSAWIGYDDKNLYAIFVCKSQPNELRARMSKREDIFADDLVGIFLDTYHDRQHSYFFAANPFGVQADALEAEFRDDDFTFDTLWYSNGKLTPDGFVVSMTIPFRSLRFAATSMQTWGLGLARMIPINNETSFWPYVTRNISGFNQQLGNADGMENISPGRNLQFIPYGAIGHSHFLDNPDNGIPSYKTDGTLRAGLDAKAVIHDSLTLDVALNPDFSQVESDDPQVTVNQRYEVVFPEKRPFFLENNSYFSTLEPMFFSRRIIDPEYGARLSGKLGRWNMGMLAIDDRAAASDDEQTLVDAGQRAHIGVLRVQREFGKQSAAGILLTDREFGGTYSRVGAADARIKLSTSWTLSGQAMSSQSRDVYGHRTGGDAFIGDLVYGNRNWFYNFNYTDRAEGFGSALGYVPRVNIRRAENFINRRFHPNGRILKSWGPRLFMMAAMDHRSVQQDWRVGPGLNFELARSTFLNFGGNRFFERYNNINFTGSGMHIGGHTEFFKRATFDGGYSQGQRINYDPADGLPAFLADGRDWEANFTFRPLSRMKLEQIYYGTQLRLRTDSLASVPLTSDGRPAAVFMNHLMRTRMNYQFTRELSLRLILDYNAMLDNPDLISYDRQKRVSGDVLLTYLVHPGTAFYIGYTDRLENLALFPGNPPYTRRTDEPWITNGRQFFAKVSYLFRF